MRGWQQPRRECGPSRQLLQARKDFQANAFAVAVAAIGAGVTKGDGMSVIEHCDRFYYWLQHKGVNAGRNNVVKALGDKCEVFMPGIYDESVYAAEGAAAEE